MRNLEKACWRFFDSTTNCEIIYDLWLWWYDFCACPLPRKHASTSPFFPFCLYTMFFVPWLPKILSQHMPLLKKMRPSFANERRPTLFSTFSALALPTWQEREVIWLETWGIYFNCQKWPGSKSTREYCRLKMDSRMIFRDESARGPMPSFQRTLQEFAAEFFLSFSLRSRVFVRSWARIIVGSAWLKRRLQVSMLGPKKYFGFIKKSLRGVFNFGGRGEEFPRFLMKFYGAISEFVFRERAHKSL